MVTKNQICTRCVMDTTAHEIQFNKDGVCNFCTNYLHNRSRFEDKAKLQSALNTIVKQIKKVGEKNEYDCIIGVSGGTDSTYVAYIVHKLGLRPLAVHLDNGWNSELAVANIESTLTNMGIDLYTHVLDWDEFKDIQKSFLLASTPDTEMPTDHAIRAVLLKVARDKNIKYIINGRNFSTEGILPVSWSYGPFDWKYLKGLQKKFGKVKLKSFPHLTLLSLFYHYMIRKVQDISILNYVEYEKKKAVDLLINEIGWRDYGGKHYESIFTRYYQAYILPEKFNIDKRKAHYSVLVASCQMKRADALELLKEPTYDPSMLEDDRNFFIKKLQLTDKEFENILTDAPKSYKNYSNDADIFLLDNKNIYVKLIKFLKKLR